MVYQGFPSLGVIVLLLVFFAFLYLTQNKSVSFLVAFAAAVLVMWRWTAAGRRLNSWRCPRCSQGFSRGLPWSFPPKKCPHCGEPTPQ